MVLLVREGGAGEEIRLEGGGRKRGTLRKAPYPKPEAVLVPGRPPI
jgi:hypothetical protein